MKKIRLLVSLMTRENDYQLEQAASAQEAATSLGIDAQIMFADNDAITQGTQLLKIIQVDPRRAARRDYLRACRRAVPPASSARRRAGGDSVGAAQSRSGLRGRTAANVPSLAIFSIGSDQKEVGRIQGQQLAALVRNGGGVLHIQGPSENIDSERSHDRFASDAAARTFRSQLCAASGPKRARNAASSRGFASTPRRKSRSVPSAAQNDAMAMGARKAFSSMDNLRTGIVGCGCHMSAVMELQRPGKVGCARECSRRRW